MKMIMNKNVCMVCSMARHAKSCPSSCEMHRLLRALENWATAAMRNSGGTFLQELCMDIFILLAVWR